MANHPHVAIAYDKNDDKVGYLKFIEKDSNELVILNLLNNITSPHNHVITRLHTWPVKNGIFVLLPPAGRYITTSLKNISVCLWDVVRQLFEGIGFLHQNHIAHMDIKSQNLMIPEDYGRLTIIDFNASIHLASLTQSARDIVGTDGYMAPEVNGSQPYNPIRADLYSCGLVVEELCNKSAPSSYRSDLLNISESLMDPDPMNRPSMSDVLDCWKELSTDMALDDIVDSALHHDGARTPV